MPSPYLAHLCTEIGTAVIGQRLLGLFPSLSLLANKMPTLVGQAETSTAKEEWLKKVGGLSLEKARREPTRDSPCNSRTRDTVERRRRGCFGTKR